jgi:hypothetical protein
VRSLLLALIAGLLVSARTTQAGWGWQLAHVVTSVVLAYWIVALAATLGGGALSALYRHLEQPAQSQSEDEDKEISDGS